MTADEARERRIFLEQFNARYDELRADPVVWAEIEAERAVESGAIGDASGARLSRSSASVDGPVRAPWHRENLE